MRGWIERAKAQIRGALAESDMVRVSSKRRYDGSHGGRHYWIAAREMIEDGEAAEVELSRERIVKGPKGKGVRDRLVMVLQRTKPDAI